MAVGSIIEVFNRAPYPLNVKKDGREFKIPVGRSHITSDLLHFAKQQNPIPGTEDPGTLTFQSLISYIAPEGQPQRDPLDAIPLEVLQAMPKERMDRNKLDPHRQNSTELAMHSFPKATRIEQPSREMAEEGAQGFASARGAD